MYRYQSLQNVSLEQIAQCFNLAFSDYEQSISFTQESLKYYLTASAVDLSLSFGAFCREEMVGFILNSSGVYNGESVVFDAGTGVVPDHRGKRVFSELFAFTCQQLRSHGVAKYYLEVLQSNDHAVSIYSKKGFTIRREYAVLVASGPKRERDSRVTVASYEGFLPFATAYSVAPSYEHTSHTVNENPQIYEVRYLDDRAYCIYAKRNGEIIQMHYNELDALKEVMTAITEQYPKSMAKNVDCGCADVLQMLAQIGYREFLKQYEMVLDVA